MDIRKETQEFAQKIRIQRYASSSYVGCILRQKMKLLNFKL